MVFIIPNHITVKIANDNEIFIIIGQVDVLINIVFFYVRFASPYGK